MREDLLPVCLTNSLRLLTVHDSKQCRHVMIQHVNYYFFATLLSPVLDGFDQLIKLFSALSLLSINTATSEKFSRAVIRTRAGWAWSVNATAVRSSVSSLF